MSKQTETLKLALETLGKVTTEMLALKDALAERGARPTTNVFHQRLWDSAFKAYTDHALPAATAMREALAEQPAQQEPVSDTELINRGCHYQTELTKPAQQEPSVHAISGRTADELWLETGRLRSELADLKAQQQEPVAAPPCPDCDGSGVDGDVGSDGQVVTIACSGCAGSGVARYRGKCPEGRRCLHGCLIGESCYHKRYTSPQPAQQQEPVAWLWRYNDGDEEATLLDPQYFDHNALGISSTTPLYTTPPHRKPLTMQERTSIVRANTSFHDKNEIDAYGVIDDVEAAHGIKENT